MNIPFSIAVMGLLIFAACLFSGLFQRTKLPDVPFLMLLGLCLQPISNKIMPADSGALGAFVSALALIAVLVEGGLDLPFATLRRIMRHAFTLAVLSFLTTAILVGFATHGLTGLNHANSFLFGAMVGSTSPAVIIPLVRQIGMKTEGQAILSLESVTSNVLSVMAAFALLNAFHLGRFHLTMIFGQTILSLVLSPILGLAAGILWLRLLMWVRTSANSLFTTFAFGLTTFGLAEALQCSGYTAALVFGVTMGNGRFLSASPLGRRLGVSPVAISAAERQFLSEIVFLLRGLSFVYIGLTIRLNDLGSLFSGFLLTLPIFALRIPVSRLSVNRAASVSDASVIAVMAPKGLAVAALASIVAHLEIPGAGQIKNLSFAVLFFSISISSLLVFLLKRTAFSRCYAWIFSEPREGDENWSCSEG